MSQVYYKLGKIFQAEKNVLKSAEYFKKAVRGPAGRTLVQRSGQGACQSAENKMISSFVPLTSE